MRRPDVEEEAGMTTRVLAVEPSRIVRRGIREELAGDGSFVVAEAATAAEALASVSEHRPEVVLLSFSLPDRSCPEVCGAILERLPSTAVVVLAAQGDEASVRSAIEAGARGYVLRDADDLDLVATIRRVLAGENVIDPRASAYLLDARTGVGHPKLSAQELNVLRLVAEGLTNPEIGSRLFLSRHTVKEYVSHAMHKLEATNRIEAVRNATALGLIEGVGAPATRPEPPETRTLVYNESGEPIRSSELKVTPVKIDKLQSR